MLYIVIFLICAAIVVFLTGPRVPIDPTIREFNLPADLDAYLRMAEARFSDLVPHTEKTIVWADPIKKQQTPVSIIYLHGFSATRQETVPLADMVARELGANLFYTRLTGHGRPAEFMGAATVNDWLNDAAEALAIGRRLGEKVIVLSVSTGGTLATWLAAWDRSEDVLAYILISPNFMPAKAESRLLMLPWAKILVPLVYGKIWHWTPVNALHGQYWTTDYPMAANITMMGLVQFVRKLDFSQMRRPVLVCLSHKDEVVNPHETEKYYARIGTAIKQKIVIDDAQDPRQHVIAGDILSPNTTQRIANLIVDFVRPLM